MGIVSAPLLKDEDGQEISFAGLSVCGKVDEEHGVVLLLGQETFCVGPHGDEGLDVL